MNQFAAIDVETANADFASICQIGIAFFRDNKLVDTFETLVDPQDEFDEFNILIHGITPAAVMGALTYPQIHSTLLKSLTPGAVVHHTAFDRTALIQVATRYNLQPPDFRWLDSARVARRVWEDCRSSGYGLAELAAREKIEFKHHNALEDARAAGEILLAAMRDSRLSLDEWLIKAYQKISIDEQIKDLSSNPDGPLSGETIVFTGALSITRIEAARIAAQAGCQVDDDVNKKTTILVVGDQDIRKLAGREKSSKHRKAENMIAKGKSIRIIRETDFFQLVENS